MQLYFLCFAGNSKKRSFHCIENITFEALMKKYILLPVSMILLAFVSCTEKLSLNEPWKEIMVIYGFLDHTQAVQYVRLTKTFLGDGDNSGYAKIPDSIYYDAKIIDVKLYEYAGNAATTLLRTITLRDTILQDLPPGAFAQSPNRLFYTNQALDVANTYKIVAKNIRTGYEAKASTKLISILPLVSSSLFSVITGAGNDRSYSNFSFSQKSTPSTKSFQCSLQFFFADSFNNGSVTEKMLEYKYPLQILDNPKGGVTSNQIINGRDFMGFLKSNRANAFPANGAFRRARGVYLTQTVAAEELTNYYSINKPSSALLLEKPVYTNITNGVGIFSSRAYRVQGNLQRGGLMGLSDGTKQVLASDSIGLGFVYP
jgi:hypothetical protein